jgi:hypothetical protein
MTLTGKPEVVVYDRWNDWSDLILEGGTDVFSFLGFSSVPFVI